MHRMGVWRVVLVAALAFAVTGCGGAAIRSSEPSRQPAQQAKAPEAPRTGPVRVAVLAPLSGDYAPVGQQLVNAAALALFENEQAAFEIVPFDTKGTPSGATEAAKKAREERADMVIGPLFGRHVQPVRQAMAGNDVAILAFTNDTEQAGDNVFVMGLSVDSQIEKLAEFLRASNRGRLLVFGPNNDYTQRAIAAVRSLDSQNRLELVRAATFDEAADFNTISDQVKQLTEYESRRANWRAFENRLISAVRGSNDPAGLLRSEAGRFPADSVRHRMLLGMASVYNQQLSRGRNQALSEVISRIQGVDASPSENFDAVLLPFGSENLVAVGSMLDLYNAGLPFAQVVGTDLWQQTNLAQEPSFHRAWHTDLEQAALEPFVRAYRSTYQAEPDSIAVLGYYAGRVASAAVAEQVRPIRPSFVTRPQGFGSEAGQVRFGPDNLMRQPLSVYEVTPDGPKELPAPPAPPTS